MSPCAPFRPVKVLLLVESMEVAGAEQVVLSLARGLDKHRFHPIVGCLTTRGPLAAALSREGVPVVALGKRPGVDLRLLVRLVGTLRRHRVDILHTHVWPADVWGRVAAKIARVPVVMMTAHSVDVWKSRAQLLVDRCLSRVSDRIVCVSEAVRRFYASAAGIRPDKLAVITNGIDASVFEGLRGMDVLEKRRQLGVSVEGPVLTVVARLLPEKGIEYFLEALVEIRRLYPAAAGLIVGAGPMRGELEALGEAMGFSSGALRFLGERRDVPEILAATDVFVLPSSLREGLSISLLEAMAARRPVVVTDIGGNGETVDNERTGLVVPPKDAHALAQAVSRLLRDEALARAMAEAARVKVEEAFGIERMVRQTEALYTELVERRRGWLPADSSAQEVSPVRGGQG